ncbi:MAG: hypothetical protein MUC86_03425 [Burkholderiaceae bacterium]|jgi:hypothetical protein|nr:hypothetical protein [Burkholderiaceae bacterium]
MDMNVKRPVSEAIDAPARPPISGEILAWQPLLDAVIGQFVTVAPRLKPSELVQWVRDLGPTHEPALRDLFFGTIEWPRASGKPDTPTMSEAFATVHARPDAFLDGRDGFAWFTLIEMPYSVQPTLVDGPSDDDLLRVSYCGVYGPDPIQQVRIRGIDGTTWRTPDGRQISSGRPTPWLWSLDPANRTHFLPPFRIELI